MKWGNNLPLFLIASCCFFSCNRDQVTSSFPQMGNWVRRSAFPGEARSGAVSFTIGNFAYLGSGLNASNESLGDFWKYDPLEDEWVQSASLPIGAERNSAVAFVIDKNGFCGTGLNGTNYLKDFYRFDPVLNNWEKVNASFPGKARSEAVAFGLGNQGYVGTGYDGDSALADFYQYDLLHDQWNIIPFNGVPRYGASVFSYNNKAYLVTGTNGKNLVTEFLEFDPGNSNSAWKTLHAITNASAESFDDGYTTIARSDGASFVIGQFGYITMGRDSTISYPYTWQYDFSLDLWSEKTPFEGSVSAGAVGMSVKNRGYLASGLNSQPASNFIWEFQPNVVMNPNDN